MHNPFTLQAQNLTKGQSTKNDSQLDSHARLVILVCKEQTYHALKPLTRDDEMMRLLTKFSF